MKGEAFTLGRKKDRTPFKDGEGKVPQEKRRENIFGLESKVPIVLERGGGINGNIAAKQKTL